MPMYTKSGRSLWPVVVGALLVVVIGLVVALVAVATRDEPGATAEPSPTPTHTHEGVPGGTPELGDPPTGCLAGPARDAGMVLSTQAEAPHSTYGAVEMAASYMRWTTQFPVPAAEQIATVEDNVVSPDAAPDKRDLQAAFTQAEDQKAITPATGEPYGTPFFVSTRNGSWVVDPSSTEDRVTVHLSVGMVVNDALSDGAYGVGSPVLVWEGDAWRLVDMVPTDTPALEAGGTSFTGGC